MYVLFQGAVESIAMKTPRERTQLFEEISRYMYMYNLMHFGNIHIYIYIYIVHMWANLGITTHACKNQNCSANEDINWIPPTANSTKQFQIISTLKASIMSFSV